MSGVGFFANSGEIATGTSPKTLVQIAAAANHRVHIKQIDISFDGISTTAEPIVVDLLRQSTAGTMSALTPVKRCDADDETLQTTAQHTASAEPTAGDVLKSVEVHPQSRHSFVFNPPLAIKGGGRLGVRVTAPAGVNAIVNVEGEE